MAIVVLSMWNYLNPNTASDAWLHLEVFFFGSPVPVIVSYNTTIIIRLGIRVNLCLLSH